MEEEDDDAYSRPTRERRRKKGSERASAGWGAAGPHDVRSESRGTQGPQLVQPVRWLRGGRERLPLRSRAAETADHSVMVLSHI